MGGAGGGVTTKKLCLDLTSAVEGTSIEVVRLVVKEGTEEEYVIDLKKREVFPQKYESANNLTVSHSEKPEETFEVKKMACGGIITKLCGIIELPKTYGPGLDCTWTFNAAEPVEYKFDTFDISKQGDEFWINDIAKTSKPEGENLELQTGNTIRFKSGDTSDGNTKFKMTFKKKGEDDPKTDPNNCKQWFKEEDKAIKDKTCPYEYPVWHFKGKTYEKMQAREATVEELEADGKCEPEEFFAVETPTVE